MAAAGPLRYASLARLPWRRVHIPHGGLEGWSAALLAALAEVISLLVAEQLRAGRAAGRQGDVYARRH